MHPHHVYAAVSSLFLGVGLIVWVVPTAGEGAPLQFLLAGVAWGLATLSPWSRAGATLTILSVAMGLALGTLIGPGAATIEAALIVMAVVGGWEGLELARRIRTRLRATRDQGGDWAAGLLRLHLVTLLVAISLAASAVLAVRSMVPVLLGRFSPPRFADSLEASAFPTVWIAALILFVFVAAATVLWPQSARRPGTSAGSAAPSSARKLAPTPADATRERA